MATSIPQFGQKIADKPYRNRPGAYGIIVKDNLIAIAFWREHYFLPGGGIDQGESPKKALKREVLEEIGWEIEIIETIAESKQYVHNEVKGLYLNKIQTFFSARPIKFVTEDSELDHELVWLSLENARNKLVEDSQRWALKTFVENT